MSSGEHAPSVVLPRARALERERARTKRASMPRPSEATATVAARASLVGLVAMAIVIVVCSGHTAILTPDSTRPLPPWLAGPLSGLGPDLGLGGVIAVLSVMCSCYWALVALGHRLSGRIIVATVILLHLILALAPPLLSTDVFSYGAYGRMGAIYSFNPYLFGPRAISFDPLVPADRRSVDADAHRLRAAVHRDELLARPAEHRVQRCGLQGDHGRLQPGRDRRHRTGGTAPGRPIRRARWRWSGSTRCC